MNNNVSGWFSLILGILVLTCGISLFFTPYESYLMITFFIPFAVLFYGINCTCSYVAKSKIKSVGGWTLAEGIISIIFGVWLLFKPGITFITIPMLIGIWVLCSGAFRIIGAITVRKSFSGWIWFLVLGSFGILFGIFLLNHPIFTAAMVSYMIAAGFVFVGIQGIAYFLTSKDKPSAA